MAKRGHWLVYVRPNHNVVIRANPKSKGNHHTLRAFKNLTKRAVFVFAESQFGKGNNITVQNQKTEKRRSFRTLKDMKVKGLP